MIAIPDKKKFLTTKELREMGYSYYKIGRLEEKGLIMHFAPPSGRWCVESGHPAL